MDPACPLTHTTPCKRVGSVGLHGFRGHLIQFSSLQTQLGSRVETGGGGGGGTTEEEEKTNCD
jgi:hypothetical protein